MRLISMDLGSYSVKFLEFKLEKNNVVYQLAREVVLDSDEYDVTAEDIQLDLQLKIAKDFLQGQGTENRLIMNAPSEIVTTRFLELPVGNRKKAQMMIPFQLEEDIPFSLAQSHIASSIRSDKTASKALVNISPKDEFGPFFEKLEENSIAPRIVTSQGSVFESFIRQNRELLPQTFCILDLGHETTKAYFFFNKELLAIHKSYIAGKTLSEVIAENYKIEFDEATLYKHQNCFLLTEDQYPQVDESQRTFANLMDKTFAPLIHEFKRWEIGFRILQGEGISEIFITGGTSNIQNIHNFLAEKLETKTSFLETFGEAVDASSLDVDEKFRRKFAYANLQAQAYKDKSSVVNFLHGEYAIQGQSDLPLRSFSFIAVRAALVTLLLIVSFSIERLIIHRDIRAVDKSLSSIAKNPVLEMTARQRRIMRLQPEVVYRELARREKAIEQEVSVLQASANTNALSPLKKLANVAEGSGAELLSFESVSGGDFRAVFKTKELEALDSLDKQLNTSGIKNVFTDKNESKLTVSLSGSEE